MVSRVPSTESPVQQKRRSRLRLVGIILGILVFLYISSYFVLTRLSLSILQHEKVFGFYYVPCSLDTLMKDDMLRDVNDCLHCFYYPLTVIDVSILGSEGPAGYPEVHGFGTIGVQSKESVPPEHREDAVRGD